MIKESCDSCSKDVSEVDSGYDEYKFYLSAAMIKNISRIKFSVLVSHPLPDSVVFCSFECLKDWVERQS